MRKKDWTLAAITLFVLGGGGLTLFNFDLHLPIPHIKTSEEKTEDQDNQLFVEALGLSSENTTSSTGYISSIKKLMGISKEYVKKDEVSKLYNHCISGYVSSIITESNEFLDEDKYDTASDHIKEAKKLLSSIINYEINTQDLDQQQVYIENFKEINNEFSLGNYEKVIKLTEKMGSDKRIQGVLVKTLEKFEEKTIEDVNKQLSNNDIKSAKVRLNNGLEVFPASEKLRNKQSEIQNKEKQIEIKLYKEKVIDLRKKEDWKIIIQYINGLPSEIQNEFKDDLDMAKNNLSQMLITKCNEFIKKKDYADAFIIMNEEEPYLKDNKDYNKLYKILSDYSIEKLKFKKTVNNNLDLMLMKDVDSNEYNSITYNFTKSGDELEFIVKDTAQLMGTLFLRYNGTNFDESVSVKVTFKNEKGDVLQVYENLTFKKAIPFSLSMQGSDYVTMKAEWNKKGSLEIAIR